MLEHQEAEHGIVTVERPSDDGSSVSTIRGRFEGDQSVPGPTAQQKP